MGGWVGGSVCCVAYQYGEKARTIVYERRAGQTCLGEELDHLLARRVALEVGGDGEVGEEDGDGRDALVQVVVQPRHLREHLLLVAGNGVGLGGG